MVIIIDGYKNGQRNITRKELQATINQIKEKITKDEFNICPRYKNEEFKRRFRLTKKDDFKPILLNLTCNDFDKCDNEDQPESFGEGIVYVFIKEYRLKNITGMFEYPRIYIKIKIKIPNVEGDLPIISFHECEY